MAGAASSEGTDMSNSVSTAHEQLESRRNRLVALTAANLCTRCGFCTESCHFFLPDREMAEMFTNPLAFAHTSTSSAWIQLSGALWMDHLGAMVSHSMTICLEMMPSAASGDGLKTIWPFAWMGWHYSVFSW